MPFSYQSISGSLDTPNTTAGHTPDAERMQQIPICGAGGHRGGTVRCLKSATGAQALAHLSGLATYTKKCQEWCLFGPYSRGPILEAQNREGLAGRPGEYRKALLKVLLTWCMSNFYPAA